MKGTMQRAPMLLLAQSLVLQVGCGLMLGSIMQPNETDIADGNGTLPTAATEVTETTSEAIRATVYAKKEPELQPGKEITEEEEKRERHDTLCAMYARDAARPSDNVEQNVQLLMCHLFSDYLYVVRPEGAAHNGSGPVVVKTRISLQHISAVSVALMEYAVQLRFEQTWRDSRLAYSHLRKEYRLPEGAVVRIHPDQSIWRPDTFFQNEKNGYYHKNFHDNVPYQKVTLSEDGVIYYDKRMTLTLACWMLLQLYPMDSQECNVVFASYAYTTDDIVYEWADEPVRTESDAGSLLPDFVITDMYNTSCTSQTSTGTYSCLRVGLSLRRTISYFIMQVYIPTGMLVCVSWVSYWIDWRASAGRVPMSILMVLTMIKANDNIQTNLPPVSYTRAIDVWTNGCIVFLFACLLEYAFVNYIGMLETRKKTHMESMAAKPEPDAERAKSPEKGAREPSVVTYDEAAVCTCPSGAALLDMEGDKEDGSGTTPANEIACNYSEDWHSAGSSYAVRRSRRRMVLRQLGIDKCAKCKNVGTTVRDTWLVRRARRFVYAHVVDEWHAQGGSTAHRIDVLARFLMPAAFVLFNIVYWTALVTLSKEDKGDLGAAW